MQSIQPRSLNLPLLLILVMFVGYSTHAQTLSTMDTVAHYPLMSSNVDITGTYDTAQLVNIPLNGIDGAYCNGIYVYSGDPNGSLIRTPYLNDLYATAFAVQVQFKLDSLPSQLMPLFVCGDSWRYLGFLLTTDGNVMYNFNNTWHDIGGPTITTGEWHTATCVYTKEDTTAQYWLDGTMWASTQGTLDRPNDDGRVSNTDFGFGRTFKGYLRNLIIFSNGEIVSATGKIAFDNQISLYPNPASDHIHLDIPAQLTWTMSNTLGLPILTGVGPMEDLNVSKLPGGQYAITLRGYNGTTVKSMFFIKL